VVQPQGCRARHLTGPTLAEVIAQAYQGEEVGEELKLVVA
jgi:hypothetical protein